VTESPEPDVWIDEAAVAVHRATRIALHGEKFDLDPAEVSAVAIAVLDAAADQLTGKAADLLRAVAENLHAVDISSAPRVPFSAFPQVAAICGSTRFRSEIADANRELTLEGFIVVAPGVFAHDGDAITDGQKAALDQLHLRKLDLADLIYVVNPGGYIGESTTREIAYARAAGKTVRFLVEEGR